MAPHVLPDVCEPVKYGPALPNGSPPATTEALAVEVKLRIGVFCEQRSERASPHEYRRLDAKAAGVPFTVTQYAKLALPSASVSNSTHASPELLPDHAVSSQPHVSAIEVAPGSP